MKKVLALILALAMSLTLFACNSKETDDKSGTKKPLKIGFFVSDYSNTFHQAQYEAAKQYAKEQWGAEVIVFDGKGDSATMTKNLDQILAQGIDMATLHLWDDDAALAAINECLDKKVVMASFFGPFKGTGIPAVRNDEAGISRKMGVEMATEWKKAHPDKPIVMVELGWPDNNEVITGRTDPFVEGVKSVDASAKNLGCQDASGGADAAKSIMAGILNSNPEVNLIYAEASNLATGVMSALVDAGRGVLNKDGSPATELVCSCDFDDAQYKEIYVNNSSLVASLGLSPSETGIARVQNLMDIHDGKVKQKSDKEEEIFCSAYNCSKYSMDKDSAAAWLSKHWGITVK
jgi:ABC-type sugar transport system substrate-binding protein